MSLLMSVFKMNSKDAYPLISEEMDHSLSFSMQVRLKIHLGIYNLC